MPTDQPTTAVTEKAAYRAVQTTLVDAEPPVTDAKGAVLSADGVYRYRLWRRWDPFLPRLAWVMLNPSTADADQDDPTIRRCIGFAKTWDYVIRGVQGEFYPCKPAIFEATYDAAQEPAESAEAAS